VYVDDQSVLSGPNSLKLETPGGYDYYVGQTLTLFPNTTYKLQFQAKTNIAHPLEVHVDGAKGLSQSFIADLTTGKQQFAFTFNSGSETSARLYLQAAL